MKSNIYKTPIVYLFMLAALISLAMSPLPVNAETVKSYGSNAELSRSLRNEAQAAIDRGKKWLVEQQQEDGHWSNPEFPALTALPLWALSIGEDKNETIEKAVDFILSCRHDNGAIYREPTEERKGGGLSNYNTAVCMVALNAVGDPDLVPVIQKAREFIAQTQHFGDDIYHGGMGYDASTGRDYADLSNSYLAFEAMRLTENVEDLRKSDEEMVDLDWEAARKFIERCHNDPRFNDRPWANPNGSEQGGFAYHPDQTRAGTETNKEGVVYFRSMPGMSYAGLLSYIYADVDRDDPRVTATVNWAANHWSLDTASRDPEKTGTDREEEGLFYMYNVMAKGLAAYDQDVFNPDSGSKFNWRVELIEKLIGLQQIESDGTGYWVNDVSRYWEGDKVLTTSYALIALQFALGDYND